MKKILCVVLSVFMATCFSGCNATPLKEKLIVQGIGVDVAEQGFLVTLQVYAPSADNTAQSDFQLFSAEGKTVYQALRHIDENTGKRSYFSDTEVVIFSYQSLQQNLWHNLEYFIRSNEMSTDVCMAVSMENAAELFQIEKEGLNMPAKVISNALHYGKSDARPFSGELMTVSSRLLSAGGDISLPIVQIETRDQKQYLRLNGVLCFQGERPSYSMSEQQKWVYNWLHEYYDDRALVFPFHQQLYSAQIRSANSKITTDVKNGVPHFQLSLALECDIWETNSAKGILLSQMDELQQALQTYVQTLTLQTVRTVFSQQNCDVFEFGRVLQKQQPHFFKGMNNWRSIMPLCNFTCQADVVIARAGQGNIE